MENNRNPASTAEAFLLQRHQMLLLRQLAIRIVNRSIYLAIIGFAVLIDHPLVFSLGASMYVSCLITFIWHFEGQSLNRQLTALEETIAKRSSDEWEDTYIRSRYHMSPFFGTGYSVLAFSILRFEPLLWFSVSIGLSVFRLIAMVR